MGKNDKRKGSRGLTKADLTDAVYERHGGLTKHEAADIVDAIFQTVKTTLGDGRPVKIKNFGTFEVMRRKGRMGVNPASGEKMFIPPRKGLAFRPAERLKQVVDEEKARARKRAAAQTSRGKSRDRTRDQGRSEDRARHGKEPSS
jgi:integration host factor subunit alpha